MDTSATPPVTTVAAQPNSEQVVLTALQHHESWQALGRCSLLQLWPFTYNGLIQGEVSLDTWLRSALFRAQQFIAEGVEGVVEGDRWNIVQVSPLSQLCSSSSNTTIQYMASNIDRSFFAHLRIPAKQSTGPSPRQHKLLSHTIQFMGMTENPDGLERNLRSYRDAMDDATSRLIGALLIRLMLLDKLSAALLRPSDTVTEHPPQPLRPLGLWGTKHQVCIPPYLSISSHSRSHLFSVCGKTQELARYFERGRGATRELPATCRQHFPISIDNHR